MNKIRRPGLTVCAAAALLVLGMAPAWAAPTVTISAGTAAAGTTVPFGGSLTIPPSGTPTAATLNFKDLATGVPGKCTGSSLAGTTKAGSVASTGIASINGSVYNASSNPNGIRFSGCAAAALPLTISGVGATQSSSNTWAVSATSNTAGTGTNINITNISLYFDSAKCNFTVAGSIRGRYTNGNPSKIGTIAGTSNLVVSNFHLTDPPRPCLGGTIAGNGDPISVDAAWTVSATTSAYDPITATAAGF